MEIGAGIKSAENWIVIIYTDEAGQVFLISEAVTTWITKWMKQKRWQLL
jgi:hypothetical protein